MADALTADGNFPDEGSVSSRGIWQLDRRRIYRGTSDWGVERADVTEKRNSRQARGLGGCFTR